MGPLILFLTTLIWGTAFLAQKFGANALGPFAITVFRNILGGAFLVGVCLWRRRSASREEGPVPLSASIRAGVCCGIPLFLAMVAQQIGIEHTTPGICAFLTTNYVLMVPLGAAILTRTLPRPSIWTGAAAALAGTSFICLTPAEGGGVLALLRSLGTGEAWTILCAVLFSVQMLVVDHYARRVDLLVMSATQLLVCAVIGAPFVFLDSELPRAAAFFSSVFVRPAVLLPVFYLGVFSSGIAYTLQNVGQARTSPGLAAIILSMESVVGALSGYVALGDTLSPRQFLGCALVLAAAVATSLFAALAPERSSVAEAGSVLISSRRK